MNKKSMVPMSCQCRALHWTQKEWHVYVVHSPYVQETKGGTKREKVLYLNGNILRERVEQQTATTQLPVVASFMGTPDRLTLSTFLSSSLAW